LLGWYLGWKISWRDNLHEIKVLFENHPISMVVTPCSNEIFQRTTRRFSEQFSQIDSWTHHVRMSVIQGHYLEVLVLFGWFQLSSVQVWTSRIATGQQYCYLIELTVGHRSNGRNVLARQNCLVGSTIEPHPNATFKNFFHFSNQLVPKD
jgi:hypothetical protein